MSYLKSRQLWLQQAPAAGSAPPAGFVWLYINSAGKMAMRDSSGDDFVAPLENDAAFSAMPTVGGNPIVERGSNSDGRWVRFADGTQIASKDRVNNVSVNNSGVSTAPWTFPLAFTNQPYVVNSVEFDSLAGIVASGNFQWNQGLTNVQLGAYYNLTQSKSLRITAMAMGWWL